MKSAALLISLATCAILSALAGTAGAPHAASAATAHATTGTATAPLPALPERLSATGFLDPRTGQPRSDLIAFTPQHPLWTDGMGKRRWLALPPGSAIDARNADAFEFPVGTKLFKEFATDRAVETRMLERTADGSWRFASYIWTSDGTDAVLAPEDGAAVPAKGLPHDRHRVPSRTDCLACHDAGTGPVLGFSALQLPPPTLRTLAARGQLVNLPPALLRSPPQINARSEDERAALGYLHGNCGHCHNDAGPLASLDLSFAQSATNPRASATRTLDTLLGRSGRFRTAGASARVVPGQQHASVIAVRMQSDNPFARMPPLGVQVIDRDGLALIERWIREVRPLAPAELATSEVPRNTTQPQR
jgi:hypothetical protein